VVLVNGSAVAMPWIARVPAVLEAWLGGQASGAAIADVITGRVNPAGRLAETFPVRLADTPAYLSFPEDGTGYVHFTEGLFTGYRWYDARQLEPLFPFGHGLSYTTFEYNGLTLEPAQAEAGDNITVSLRVRNMGQRAGDEVVQVYVREEKPRLPRPDKELKAFARISLEAGAETTVRLTLTPRDFAYYDDRVPGWVVGGGTYEILVGASSRDIRLRATATVAASGVGRIPNTRLTPLRAWLSDRASRDAVWPKMGRLFQMLGAGEAVSQMEAGTLPLADFFGDMPISKLVMFGAMSEAELAELLAQANQA
jgi:beta-glucosidase